MSETNDMPNLPWQTLQRRVAEGLIAGTRSYPGVRETVQPHWRFTPAVGSWLNRSRSGVLRPVPAVSSTV